MKAKIEEYERLHKETEDLKESLDKIFEKAFNYLRGKFLYLIDDKDKREFALFEFWGASEYDGFRREDDNIILHYYDYYYDSYEGAELPPIPISIIEDEAELDKWFDERLKEYEKSKEQHRLEVEQKKREKELAEYKRLKEIYDGIESTL